MHINLFIHESTTVEGKADTLRKQKKCPQLEPGGVGVGGGGTWPMFGYRGAAEG